MPSNDKYIMKVFSRDHGVTYLYEIFDKNGYLTWDVTTTPKIIRVMAKDLEVISIVDWYNLVRERLNTNRGNRNV